MIDPLEQIKNNVQNWLEEKELKTDFVVSMVQNLEFGDFTTNVAMQISKSLAKNPREIAEELKSEIENWNLEFIDRVEVAGPGFINFYLSNDYLLNQLQEIVEKKDEFGKSSKKKGETTVVEFGDPNPFKEIHIGHLRIFFIGESFSRLLESQGAEVIRANYQGDVGMHVAKALYGLMADGKWQMANGKNLNAKKLAEAYAFGAKKFEEDENVKKEIQEINKKIYQEDSDLKQIWEKGKQISLEAFEKIYERVGIKYDKYYFESDTAKRGREIVLDHVDDGVFEKDDGAIIFKGEKEGLHTRVFLTSEDYATYEAKDLALAVMKDEEIDYDKSIILTGNEQKEYFEVMLAALKKISPELYDKTKHLSLGHVRLKEGKMSSRTGDAIAGGWLLDEAVKKVGEQFSEMDEDTTEKVGVGAVKYSMLKFGVSSDIHFDFKESISLEGNSGPYLQYTYVRTRSVLEKAEQVPNEKWQIPSELEKEEEELLRFLTLYPYFMKKAADDFAPNILCNYLFELSQKFNLFYQKHKIIGSSQEEFRLSLTDAVSVVLKNGLNILGIETVEKM